MAQFELILPKMGESVAEATVTNWLKNVGDVIDAEESALPYRHTGRPHEEQCALTSQRKLN